MHLGAKPDAGNAYSQNREQELWDSFRDIITICNQKKTDLLLIAGDLFHRQPLLRELKEMNSILEMLEHTEVVMIAGNHDYIKKNSYYRTFSWAPHVHMICSQEIDCVADFLNAGGAEFSFSAPSFSKHKFLNFSKLHLNLIIFIISFHYKHTKTYPKIA